MGWISTAQMRSNRESERLNLAVNKTKSKFSARLSVIYFIASSAPPVKGK